MEQTSRLLQRVQIIHKISFRSFFKLNYFLKFCEIRNRKSLYVWNLIQIWKLFLQTRTYYWEGLRTTTAWKCPNRVFFGSAFSLIGAECGELIRKSPYSVRIWENTDKKKLSIWTLFSECTVCFLSCSLLRLLLLYLVD